MRRRRLARTPVAEMVYVVNVFNVDSRDLQLQLEDAAEEENGSLDFDRSTSSYQFWFSEMDEAGRFLRAVKKLGIKVVD